MQELNVLDFIPPQEYTVIYLGAPWCRPCQNVAPEVETLSSQYPETPFIKVSIPDHETWAKVDTKVWGNIRGIPTLLTFENGIKTAHIQYSSPGLVSLLRKDRIERSAIDKLLDRYAKMAPTHVFNINRPLVLVTLSKEERADYQELDNFKEDVLFYDIINGAFVGTPEGNEHISEIKTE